MASPSEPDRRGAPRLSRRGLLAAAPLAALAGVAAGCAEGPDTGSFADLSSDGLWSIPAAAWRRSLGDHPPGATGTTPPFGHVGPPRSRTKRGLPLGGIGTGSFMYNLAGSFGPWHLDIGGDDSPGSRWGSPKNSGFEQRFETGAAFHLNVSGSFGRVVRTLATEDTMAAWTPLAVGDGFYAALFPKAWFVYEGLPVPAALEQLTPYVARDERWSSLPFGLFRLAVSNPGLTPVDVAAMFSFPNAPYRLPTAGYRYQRDGLRSHRVAASGISGVRLQAEHRGNPPVTNRTEWVLAVAGPAGARLSSTEDWATDGDGADLMDAFSSGALPDAPLDPRRGGRGGAVASSFRLPPGGRAVVSFVVAWDFPLVQFPDPVHGTRWAKRYTEWFPGSYRGWDIARAALDGAADLERAINAWWSPVADSDAYPLWLRTAALNELYYDVFGGVFWENGCLTRPKRLGNRPGQHLYFATESDVYRDCESLDVRHYETRHLLQLFPTIERDVLLGWADAIMADLDGITPHDAGSPVDDPWFVVGQYSGTRPGHPPVEVDWRDLPSKFVQQVHSCWRYTGDDRFLAEAYPAVSRTLEHLLSFDVDGDGIPDAAGFCTTYDNLPMDGPAIYVAVLTIGACRAAAAMADALGLSVDAARWQAAAGAAQAGTEEALWDPVGGYYHFDGGGPLASAIMIDALCGQRYAQADGLGHLLEPDRMASHLHQAYRYNVLAGGQEAGAVNVVEPSGARVASPQGRAVWPGGTYFAAAVMVRLGRDLGDGALVAAGLDMAEDVYHLGWEDDRGAFWFDTPGLWLAEAGRPLRWRAASYLRNRAAWELLVAVADPFPSAQRL